MNKPSHIFHVSSTEELEQAQTSGLYESPSLSGEGFIHCCDANQLAGVVSRYYANVDHLKLLVIDPDQLSAALIRENTVGGSELFPHVYGPIELNAIVEVRDFSLSSPERMALNDHD